MPAQSWHAPHVAASCAAFARTATKCAATLPTKLRVETQSGFAHPDAHADRCWRPRMTDCIFAAFALAVAGVGRGCTTLEVGAAKADDCVGAVGGSGDGRSCSCSAAGGSASVVCTHRGIAFGSSMSPTDVGLDGSRRGRFDAWSSWS